MDQRSEKLRFAPANQARPGRRSYRTINRVALALAIGWVVLIGLTLTTEVDDFKFYWHAAVDLLRTGDPYASIPEPGGAVLPSGASSTDAEVIAYLYPPFFAYLIQPLGLLEHWQGQWVWFGLNIAALAGLVALCLRWSGAALARRYWGVAVLAVVVAPPTRLSLQLGQVSIMLALAIVASFVLSRRRPALAGLLLALAALVKLYPALLGGYYLLRRPRGVLWWAAACGALLLGLSLLAYGVPPYTSYFQKVLLSSHYPYAAEFNISLFGFWTRLLSDTPYAVPLADLPLLARSLAVLSSVAVLGLLLWAGRGATDEDGARLQFCIWLCGMLLLSPINGSYNLVLLLLPLLVVLRQLETSPDPSLRRWLIVGTALACWPPAWTDWQPLLYNTLHMGWGILLLTPAIYGLLIYLWLLVRLARRHNRGLEIVD